LGTQVKLVFHTVEVIRAMEQAASKKMAEATQAVRTETLNTLSGSRSGRTYYVPGTHKEYTASSDLTTPAEPPAQATGRLRQSVKTSIEGQGLNIIGKVGTDLEYGKVLEYGTYDNRIAPRPWLRISFEKAESKVKGILGSLWFK